MKKALYGIDPGSGKAWAVCSTVFDGDSRTCGPASSCRRQIGDIRLLIDEIWGHTAAGDAVLLAIDAPLVSWQDFTFGPPDHREQPLLFPFDVNHFVTRPCERALNISPDRQTKSYSFQKLVAAIVELVDLPRQANPGDSAKGGLMEAGSKSFDKEHEGVSVMGHMSAPHGPVVRSFLRALKAKNLDPVFCPYAATMPTPGKVYALETHPAVSMAFSLSHSKSVRRLPKYKRQVQLSKNLWEPFRDSKLSITPVDSPWSDDDLDAMIGLVNLLDLVNDHGDWFGCAMTGYFLVPRRPTYSSQPRYAELWQDATSQFLELGGYSLHSDACLYCGKEHAQSVT